MAKSILDACCGSRMFYFEKNNPEVLFCDIRAESLTLCDGRELNVAPDIRADFTSLPFMDSSFKMVVFDPPHLKTVGKNSWTFKKYGALPGDWRLCLKQGFSECFRVLEPAGTLVFKWSEVQIKTSDILKLTPEKPLLGHISGKRANTHWVIFVKNSG